MWSGAGKHELSVDEAQSIRVSPGKGTNHAPAVQTAKTKLIQFRARTMGNCLWFQTYTEVGIF